MPVISEASGIQGGEKTSYSSYTVHTFRESGRFITTSAITVDYLLVGGGGSGSCVGGGGGGGGVDKIPQTPPPKFAGIPRAPRPP